MFSYFAIKGKLAISIRIEPSDNRDAIKRKKVKEEDDKKKEGDNMRISNVRVQ